MSQLPMFVINEKPIDAVSMGADITPAAIDIAEVTGFCVHAIWTGSPVGVVSVQGSNDNLNFTTVASANTNLSTQYLLNAENQHYRYVRVIYTRTSGSGTLTVYVSAKRN